MNIIEYAKFKKMFGGGGITPTGTKRITENGEFDVSKYEKANVNIPLPTNPVIEVDELPTENINFDAVYSCNGELYRHNASKTWMFNETISHLLDVDGDFDISFQFLNESGECVDGLALRYVAVTGGGAIPAYLTYIYGFESYGAPKEYLVYDYGTNTWAHENYKTITIMSAIEDEAFRTWLEANATCIAQVDWNKYTLTTE